MGRTDIGGSRTHTIEIDFFGGENTAKTFSEIEQYESARMLNALPRKVGGLSKRPGTIPLTSVSLPNPIQTLCNLRKDDENNILAASGDTLYLYDGEWTAQTMDTPLLTDRIGHDQFKDEDAEEVLVITDGGALKYWDGEEVKAVEPAPNDEDPLPANDLANINANHPPIGCLVYNTRVVIWDGSDTIWHSKVGFYDYFPQVDFQRFVRHNDTVKTCIAYGGALMVMMRRNIGVVFGQDIENWEQDFLDTQDGCMNERTVQMINYPDGRQEVFYLSDDGVHAIYTIDTLSLQSSARYSTRNVTKNQVKWDELGVTREEWKEAVGYFQNGRYWLVYSRGDERRGLVFDTNDQQWYPVNNIGANSFYHDEEHFYFAGENGHLMVFDSDLYSDWGDPQKANGTPVDFFWYSKLMTPKLTGKDHFWDVLMVEARQFFVRSVMDVEVNTFGGRFTVPDGVVTTTMVFGETNWGEGQWANPSLTDFVNNAKRLRAFVKGQYAQILISNNRDEPLEMFSIKFEVRVMER